MLSQQHDSSGIDAATLEAELKAAQEATLKLSAGVDLLADEIRLEQQLAALDEEMPDDEDGGAPADDDDELDIEPDELAELEGELQVKGFTTEAWVLPAFRHLKANEG